MYILYEYLLQAPIENLEIQQDNVEDELISPCDFSSRPNNTQDGSYAGDEDERRTDEGNSNDDDGSEDTLSDGNENERVQIFTLSFI